MEVEAGGRLLDIGPRQRRMVLAALVVDAGTPVSIDTLAERVWGSAAPEAPRSALYAHVARLKRVLGHVGDAYDVPVSLNRHGAGYVLDVDPQLVDLHRFLGLIEASRAQPEEDRTSTLREALDLWRGPPLSTTPGDWAVRLRTSIESQFIGATTAWAEQELRLADPEPVADRLAHVVAAYPLAEPVVALLMRALCALGRTAEALRRYADTRARLADELGAEPGPELSRLHVAILRGEFDGTAAAPVAWPAGQLAVPLAGPFTGPPAAPSADPGGGRPGPVPRQLPADLSRFTGRATELLHIDRWFTAAAPAGSGREGSTPVLVFHGPVGVGTSALAVHAAHRLAARYPDGQLYVNLRRSGVDTGPTPVGPAEALARLLRALGIAVPGVPDVDEAAVLFRSAVAGRRVLLVLDNATTAAQVRPLLPGGSGCATLVAGRRALIGLGEVGQLRLGPLAPVESAELLQRWVGAARFATEPEPAMSILDVCEGLPLALCAAGTRLAARPGWPLEELAGRLADPARRLDNLEFDGVGIRTGLAGCLRLLASGVDPADRAAAAAFAVLGTAFDAAFDAAAAADRLARPLAQVERILDRLVDVDLLEQSSGNRHWMRGLPRRYARELFADRYDPTRYQNRAPEQDPARDQDRLADSLPVAPRPRQADRQ